MSDVDNESRTPEEVNTEADWESALTQNLETPAVGDVKVTETVEVEAEAPPADVPVVEPLESWPDEFKSAFATLDAETQQLIVAREQELTGQTEALQSFQSKYQGLDPVLDPFIQLAQQRGADPAPYISTALNAYISFLANPTQTLKQLIGASGVTAEQLGLAAAEEEEFVDPQVKALQEEIAALKQGQQYTQQNLNQQQLQAATQTWTEFMSAKGEDGQPLHPYAQEVETLMAPLIQQGHTLQDAYEKTVWSVPAFREAQLKAMNAQQAQAAAQAQAAKVTAAKKAAAVTPAGDADTPAPSKDQFTNWGDALQQSLKQLQGAS